MFLVRYFIFYIFKKSIKSINKFNEFNTHTRTYARTRAHARTCM